MVLGSSEVDRRGDQAAHHVSKENLRPNTCLVCRQMSCTVGKSAGVPRRLQVRKGTVSRAGKPFGVSVDVYRGQVGGGSAPAAGTGRI